MTTPGRAPAPHTLPAAEPARAAAVRRRIRHRKQLADFVYEGGRSVLGPYLATLDASAAAVGLISGAGQAVAVVFRLATGSLAGYVLTAMCVPLLAGALRSAAALTFGGTLRQGRALTGEIHPALPCLAVLGRTSLRDHLAGRTTSTRSLLTYYSRYKVTGTVLLAVKDGGYGR